METAAAKKPETLSPESAKALKGKIEELKVIVDRHREGLLRKIFSARPGKISSRFDDQRRLISHVGDLATRLTHMEARLRGGT